MSTPGASERVNLGDYVGILFLKTAALLSYPLASPRLVWKIMRSRNETRQNVPACEGLILLRDAIESRAARLFPLPFRVRNTQYTLLRETERVRYSVIRLLNYCVLLDIVVALSATKTNISWK